MRWFKKRDDDPPHPHTATILQGLAERRISNSTATLADMLEQAKHDTSGRIYKRLMLEGELTQLFWNMRTVGEEWRGEVGHALYQTGGKLGIWPDPRSVLRYSNTALIERACEMEGINLRKMREDVRQLAATKTSVPVVACLWTHGNQSPPGLYVDYESPPRATTQEQEAHTKFWRWQAAQVLGQFIAKRALYIGALAPHDMIAPADPVRDPAWAALMHTFAKAFLYLGNWPVWCSEYARCPCNAIIRGAAEGPERHPENTDLLDARELRGPAGGRARRAAQYTPPPSQGPMYAPRRPPPLPTRPIEQPSVPPSMPSIPDFADLGLGPDPDLDPNYRSSSHLPSMPKTPPPPDDPERTGRLDRSQ